MKEGKGLFEFEVVESDISRAGAKVSNFGDWFVVLQSTLKICESKSEQYDILLHQN